MELCELQKNWDEFGRRDPFWAVLTDPRFKNNRWDPAEFFATGEADIDSVLSQLSLLGLNTARWRALDFGCAMGRLTQAICRHFHDCVGVDIAPSMIALARFYNNYPERCHYVLNVRDDLSLLRDNSFDFVFTRIVLQHIRPPQNRKFIAELTRVLDRGGALVFQVPSKPAMPRAGPDDGGPLGWTAHNALIEVDAPPTTASAGEELAVRVRVKNLSLVMWPSRGRANGSGFVQLGNHWLKEDGRMFVPDDGRAILPEDLRGGEEVAVVLSMCAPTQPGQYWLQLDMVEEGVTWFEHHGSKTYRSKINVLPSPAGVRPQVNPVMEMHGILPEDVRRTVESAGGKVAAVRDDFSAGGWESFLYFVTKD